VECRPYETLLAITTASRPFRAGLISATPPALVRGEQLAWREIDSRVWREKPNDYETRLLWE